MNIAEAGTCDARTLDRVALVVHRIAVLHDVKAEIAAADSLVDRGMTSMAMVDLMLAVEATFDVTIPQRELTPDNFQSIDSLTRLVARL